MADCIFCAIAEHQIPSNAVYEDEKILCFHDLEPQAPVHVLVIPKKHITSLDEVSEDDKELMGHIMFKIHEIATSSFSYLREKKTYMATGLITGEGV